MIFRIFCSLFFSMLLSVPVFANCDAVNEIESLQSQIDAVQLAISKDETHYYILTSMSGGSLLVVGVEAADVAHQFIRYRRSTNKFSKARLMRHLERGGVVGLGALALALGSAYFSDFINDGIVVSKTELEILKKHLENQREQSDCIHN